MIRTRRIAAVLAAVLLSLMIQMPAFADGNWKNAYLSVLKQGLGVKRAAALCDLTGDGAPELVVLSVASGEANISVYTERNDQAVAIIANQKPFLLKNPKSITMQSRKNAGISISQNVSNGREMAGYAYGKNMEQVHQSYELKKSGKYTYSAEGVAATKGEYTAKRNAYTAAYPLIGTLPLVTYEAKDKVSAIEAKFKQLTSKYQSFSTVKSVKLSKSSIKVTAGNSYTLKASVSPSTALNTSITWSSSNAQVASVDSSGKITCLSGGKATITATAASGARKSCTVTVTAPAPVSVSLSKTALALNKGESTSLTATVSPALASQKLTYKSSNPNVASVTADGILLAVASGKATITVKTINGKSAVCTVVVTNGPAVIVDISQHNYSSKMDWKQIAKNVDLLILRCGVTRTDTNPIGVGKDDRFAYYAKQCKAYGIPFGVYYYGKASDEATAVQEANMTWATAKAYAPLFYIYDAEESRLTKSIIETYMKTLKSLGAKKTGYYVAHHLYSTYRLDTSLVDFIWIPHYGENTGIIESTPSYPCDIHQYTSVGRILGFPYYVDVNRLMGTKDLSWFLTR